MSNARRSPTQPTKPLSPLGSTQHVNVDLDPSTRVVLAFNEGRRTGAPIQEEIMPPTLTVHMQLERNVLIGHRALIAQYERQAAGIDDSQEEEPIAPARGVTNGLAAGIVLWALIIGTWLVLR